MAGKGRGKTKRVRAKNIGKQVFVAVEKSAGTSLNKRNIIIAVIFVAAAVCLHFAINSAVEYFARPEGNKLAMKFKVKSGKEAIPHIHIKEAYALFQKGKAVFVDARSEGEYEEAHIKGAVSIPVYAAKDRVDGLKDVLKGKILVTYCHGVGCHLSDKTANNLYDAGYRKLKIFFGGWNEWTQKGYPVDKKEVRPEIK